MFTEDFHIVLLFMSKTMKPFLTHIGRYLLMFFLTVPVLVLGFFISISVIGSVWGFVVLALIVMAIHWLIRRSIVLPSLVRLDRLFLGYVLENEAIPEALDKKKLTAALRDLRKRFASFRQLRFSRGIRMAALILSIDTELLPDQPDEKSRFAIGRAFKYALIGYLLLLGFLAVFLGISFLSTLGLDSALKLLIFTLGTMFAVFLYQAVLEPVIYLLAMNRMYQSLRDYS